MGWRTELAASKHPGEGQGGEDLRDDLWMEDQVALSLVLDETRGLEASLAGPVGAMAHLALHPCLPIQRRPAPRTDEPEEPCRIAGYRALLEPRGELLPVALRGQ